MPLNKETKPNQTNIRRGFFRAVAVLMYHLDAIKTIE